nr:putative reverse transcriptase, RNA-dependent DNA polymerase [Tanacetum cinerariifolium]
MFTTMNCDSLETKYYYPTQHSSQGESECLDILNLLRYVACGDGRGHSIADESHLSIQPEDHVNVIQTAPNLILEEQEMVFNEKDTPLELNEHVKEQKKSSTQEETSKRYVLPPRANQEDANAFVASVYSDEIPANTEQALNLRKWKKAMEEEMEALTKNNTREKCVLKPGKKNCRGGNLITCLIICVDDMIVTGDDKEEITKLKYLFTKFKKKDLGRLKYFLGIKVLRSKQGIFICQKRSSESVYASTPEEPYESSHENLKISQGNNGAWSLVQTKWASSNSIVHRCRLGRR